MNIRSNLIAGLTLALLTGAAGEAAAQEGQGVARAVPATELCVVEGTVTRIGTGEPLAKAVVRLRLAADDARTRFAYTNAQGRFSFTAVPPGRYQLTVERFAYVAQSYGQPGSTRGSSVDVFQSIVLDGSRLLYGRSSRGGVGNPLELRPGQQVRDLLFRLIPTGVISGRVFDPGGEPFPYVRVSVLRYGYQRGRRVLQDGESAVTNDLGEYRIFGLVPGRYFVRASIDDDRDEVRALFSEKGTLAPTFYPQATDPGRAVSLQVGPGEEVRGIDLTVQPVRAVSIRGRISGLSGGERRNAGVVLLSTETGSTSFLGRDAGVADAEAGRFQISGVVPGSYVLVAWAQTDSGVWVAREEISVGTTDVEGLNLALQPGVDVTGQLRVEGAEPGSPGGKMHVMLSTPDLPMMPMGDAEMGGQDAGFRFRSMIPARYEIVVLGLPPGYYVKSARLGPQDVLDSGVVVGTSPLPALEIVVSPAGGLVEGQVLDNDSLPVAGATVVLVPEHKRRHVERLFAVAYTDGAGRFRITGIAPGEYKVFALDEVEDGAWHDPSFLQPIEPQGAAVRVAENSRQAMELKLLRATTP